MSQQPAASFGGPSAAASEYGPSSASQLGLGFSASSWVVKDTTRHSSSCTSVKEYAYAEDKN